MNVNEEFPSMLSLIPPLQNDEEDVSYDVTSSFTNIPMEETINYIIEQIYVYKKLTPIFSKLIFRRLLIKLATSRFLKQVGCCTMGGPLFATLSNIYLVKIENDVVILSKAIFYRRFVDEIYSRQKLGDNVLLYQLKKYYPNIKLIIEVNPNKFLDTKLTNISGAYKFNVYWKNAKLPSPWTSKTPKRYKQNIINGDLHRSKKNIIKL